MEGLTAIGGTDVSLSSVQVETQYQAQAAKIEQQFVKDIGTAALMLIHSAVVPEPLLGQQLDVYA